MTLLNSASLSVIILEIFTALWYNLLIHHTGEFSLNTENPSENSTGNCLLTVENRSLGWPTKGPWSFGHLISLGSLVRSDLLRVLHYWRLSLSLSLSLYVNNNPMAPAHGPDKPHQQSRNPTWDSSPTSTRILLSKGYIYFIPLLSPPTAISMHILHNNHTSNSYTDFIHLLSPPTTTSIFICIYGHN
jgi:hypothetical protein